MRIRSVLVLMLTLSAASVFGGDDTNAPASQVVTNKAEFEHFTQINKDRRQHGETEIALRYSGQLHDQLVADGTIRPPEDALVSFRFGNTPLTLIAEEYAKYSGKQVVVAKDAAAALSFATDKSVPKTQAALLIETALADAGFLIVPTDTNAVRIIRKPKDK